MRRIFTRPKGQKQSREEIEREAFAAMRKAKAAIDPSVLAKIKNAIENSPMAEQIMGGLGKGKSSSKAVAEKQEDTAEIKKQKALEAARKAHESIKEPKLKKAESVDQAKMLDIVAKTLELNPHKSGLKKGVKDILLDKKN